MFIPYKNEDFVADTHCHTIASTHAYSTVTENAKAAAERGLSYLAITDHSFLDQEDAPHIWHFHNLSRAVDRELFGVKMIFGVETSIVTADGGINFPEEDIRYMDWVIASVHFPVEGVFDYTDAYIGVAKNPHVRVIGHCANPGARFDYDTVLPVFRNNGKLVELNEGNIALKNKYTLYKDLAARCKQLDVPVIVNSDAHFHNRIGDFSGAISILNDVEMPRELVVNCSLENFEKYLKTHANLSSK